MNSLETIPNSDLEVVEGNKSRWTCADQRRRGLHDLHRMCRYGISLRAARVMALELCADKRIADLSEVQKCTSFAGFSAMVVIRGSHVLFEHYAPDFGTDCPHSIQSITKTTINLIVGRLVEQGVLDLSRSVSHYIPEVGSGYATATLQQVLDMDVDNDYVQDFADSKASYYEHEEAMGWRLPRDSADEETQHSFLVRIGSKDTTNRSGYILYKDANSEILGWVIERASGRPLRRFLAELVDAAGLEAALYMTTDREGVPTLSGGACMTARDLARYLSIFSRWGRGVSGELVGSPRFIEQTLSRGVPRPAPYTDVRYSNHTMISGRSLEHSGWGGQYAVVNLDTGMIAVFFSVIENEHGIVGDYLLPVVQMLRLVTAQTYLTM